MLPTGRPTTVNVRVKTPKNFPVDLYYLMDLSATMKASLKEIRNLGSRLSEYFYWHTFFRLLLAYFLLMTHPRIFSSWPYSHQYRKDRPWKHLSLTSAYLFRPAIFCSCVLVFWNLAFSMSVIRVNCHSVGNFSSVDCSKLWVSWFGVCSKLINEIVKECQILHIVSWIAFVWLWFHKNGGNHNVYFNGILLVGQIYSQVSIDKSEPHETP